MSNKEIDWGYTFFSIRIYAILILLFLAGWFGPGMIQQYKRTNEMEQIHYGGSVEEANATVELHNKKIIELKNAVNNVLEENNSMYMFTNDTITTDSVTLYPDIDFDVFKPATPFGRPVIVRNNQVIDEIDTFLENKDSLGYYVYLKKNNHTFSVKRYQSSNDSLLFKLITYFKPTKEYNDRPIMKNRNKYKYLYDKKVDSFETRNFKYKEKHLKNLKKNYKYRSAILRPYYKYLLYDDSFRFYFVCYNKNITKEVFQKNIDLLLKGSLGELDCSGCTIKELQINTINSLK